MEDICFIYGTFEMFKSKMFRDKYLAYFLHL